MNVRIIYKTAQMQGTSVSHTYLILTHLHMEAKHLYTYSIYTVHVYFEAIAIMIVVSLKLTLSIFRKKFAIP